MKCLLKNLYTEYAICHFKGKHPLMSTTLHFNNDIEPLDVGRHSEQITLNWQILRVKRTCQDATAQRDSVYLRNHLKG